MALVPELVEVQIGKEVTWGTAVAPTARLMGIDTCKIRPINEAMIHSNLGSLGPGPTASLTKIAGEGSLSGEVLYEDLPYWFDSLFGEATPSGTDPYTYAYAGPTGTAPTPRIFTMAYGDGSYVYGLTGGIVNKMTISGKSGEPWKYSLDLLGEAVESDTLAALSDRTVNGVMAAHTALYIDAWGGTIGSTAITTTFFSFELSIETGRAVYHGLGSINAVGYREQKYKYTLKMSLELDATSKGYLDSIVAGSAVWQKQIRIKASNTANRDVELDIAGTALKAPENFAEVDGIVTVDLEVEGTYNTPLGNAFEATIINQVATLP